jgi:hypothetical protein
MATSIMPVYYLMMIGSSLTLVTSFIMIMPNAVNTYYSRVFQIFSSLTQTTSFLLTILPGAAALFLAHLYYTRPPTRLVSGLLIAGLSLISLYGVVGSGIAIYLQVLYSGPPLSFTGGIIGAFLSRATPQATT